MEVSMHTHAVAEDADTPLQLRTETCASGDRFCRLRDLSGRKTQERRNENRNRVVLDDALERARNLIDSKESWCEISPGQPQEWLSYKPYITIPMCSH